jgi:hypothetical protein
MRGFGRRKIANSSLSTLVAHRHEISRNLTIELYPLRMKGAAVAKQQSPDIILNIDFDVKLLLAILIPLAHLGYA